MREPGNNINEVMETEKDKSGKKTKNAEVSKYRRTFNE